MSADDAVKLELMIAVDTENGVGIWTNEVECKGAIWSCEYKFENNQLIAHVYCNKRNEEIPNLDVWKYTAEHYFYCSWASGVLLATLAPTTGIKEYFSHDNEVTLVICSREELEALDYDDDSQEQLFTIVAQIEDIKNIPVQNSDEFALSTREVTLTQTDENLLGLGGDATVYKGEYREIPVAIKEFHVQKTGSKDPYTEELERFIQLRHQNLVKMIGHVPKRRFIVLELCQNGSLHKHIHDLNLEIDWQRLNSWIKHILEGMIYLHRNDVTHRDLKSDNILIGNDWVLQITDFARAKTGIISEMSAVTSRVGTVGYMAPELLSKGDDGRNTRKIDVWSFGVILWELFTRYRPYAGLLETEIFLRTADRELKLPELPTALPVEIRSLINRCLSFEPKDRPSFEEIKEKFWKDASYAIAENHENWTEIAEECHKFAKSYHYAPRSIRTASDNTMTVEGSVNTLKLSDTPDLNAEEVAGTSQENNVANDTRADQNVVVQKVHAPSNAAPMEPIATRLVGRKPWDW